MYVIDETNTEKLLSNNKTASLPDYKNNNQNGFRFRLETAQCKSRAEFLVLRVLPKKA